MEKLDSVSLEDVVGNNTKIGAVSGNTEETTLEKSQWMMT